MRKLLFILGSAIAISANTQAADYFEDMAQGLPQLQNCAVNFLDYDNDGKMDLIITGKSANGNISNLYHNVNGKMIKIEDAPFAPYITSLLTCSDIDNDGYVDVIIGGSNGTTSEMKLYKNNAGKGFIESDLLLEGVKSGYAFCVDIDNNGYSDLVYMGETNNKTYELFIYTNEKGVLTKKDHNIAGAKLGGLAFGDFNGDSYIDMIVNGTIGTAKICTIYKNDGKGNFEEFDKNTMAGYSGGANFFTDFNNDGKLDILYPGSTSSTKTSTYINENDKFVLGKEIIAGFIGNYAFPCDITGNGYTDVITTASKVYENDGTNFTEIATLDKISLGKIATADVDGDGKVDLLITGNSATKPTRIYKNIAGNLPNATGLANLTSTKLDDNVYELKWEALSADMNNATYNLYLRNEVTGEILFAPMADLKTGIRYVSQAGNMGTSKFIKVTITGDAKDWKWSVQPIRYSFIPAAFAIEERLNTGSGVVSPSYQDAIQFSSQSGVLKVSESVSSINIFNCAGTLVSTYSHTNNSEISLNDMPKGVYVVTYSVDGMKKANKIIIK